MEPRDDARGFGKVTGKRQEIAGPFKEDHVVLTQETVQISPEQIPLRPRAQDREANGPAFEQTGLEPRAEVLEELLEEIPGLGVDHSKPNHGHLCAFIDSNVRGVRRRRPSVVPENSPPSTPGPL